MTAHVPRGIRAAAAAAVAVVILAGCTEEDTGPLAEDRLPGEVVESKSSARGTPTATLCPALTQVQQTIALRRVSADDHYRYWTYRLADHTWIAVTVVDTGVALEDWEETLDQVRAAVDECAEREDGTYEGETVIARSGERVVMVAASHDRGVEPSVDVLDLLTDVQESVADLDLG